MVKHKTSTFEKRTDRMSETKASASCWLEMSFEFPSSKSVELLNFFLSVLVEHFVNDGSAQQKKKTISNKIKA
jgi:hypothetical protein